jgi:hypothetical protein
MGNVSQISRPRPNGNGKRLLLQSGDLAVNGGTRARAVMDERQDIVLKVRLTCFYYSVTFTTSGRACEGQGRKSCFPFLRSMKIKQTAERKKVTFVPDTDFSAENELSTAENQARKSTTAETRTEL